MTEAEPGSLGRAAGSALRWNAAAAMATLCSQLLQLVILARWLAPSAFGLAATAISITGFLQGFSDLGLTYALVQRPHLDRKAWSSAWWATLVAGVLLALALRGASLWVGRWMHLEGLAALLALSSLSLPWGASAVFQSGLQRELRFARLASAEIGAACLSLCAALGWAAWRREAAALVVGQVVLAGARFVLLGLVSPRRPILRLRWTDLRPMSGFGGYQIGERALNYAVSNFDRLLVARLLGPAATGFYTVASQLAMRPLALLGPFVSRTLFPLMARLQDDPERMGKAYLRSQSVLGFLAAGIYATLFGVADPLVRALLGSAWTPAIPVLRVLALLGFLSVMGNPLGSLLLALGRAGTGFWINAAMLVARVALVAFGSRYGLAGVACGMLFATVLFLPLDFLLPWKWLGLGPAKTAVAVGWSVLPAALAAAAMSASSVVLALAPWTEVALCGALGLIVFLASAWMLQRRTLEETVADLVAKFRAG